VVEVKYPYKHLKNSIEVVCLLKKDSEIALNRRHDYYFQVTSQLALTHAEFCDFVEVDIHIERIKFDVELWTEMKSHFYFSLDRLCNM